MAFFGLNYLFGIMRNGRINEHWSCNPLVYFPFPQTIFQFNRFNALRHFICFYDVWKKNCSKDPLYKINYFINVILENSEKLYSPDKYLTIDESMIKYDGKN